MMAEHRQNTGFHFRPSIYAENNLTKIRPTVKTLSFVWCEHKIDYPLLPNSNQPNDSLFSLRDNRITKLFYGKDIRDNKYMKILWKTIYQLIDRNQ